MMTLIEEKCLEAAISNLKQVLDEIVYSLYRHPDKMISLCPCTVNIDWEGKFVDESAALYDIVMNFTNCCFHPDTGKEIFPGSMDDGKEHLMICLTIKEIMASRAIKQMLSEECLRSFNYNNEYIYIDCLEDVTATMAILKLCLSRYMM